MFHQKHRTFSILSKEAYRVGPAGAALAYELAKGYPESRFELQHCQHFIFLVLTNLLKGPTIWRHFKIDSTAPISHSHTLTQQYCLRRMSQATSGPPPLQQRVTSWRLAINFYLQSLLRMAVAGVHVEIKISFRNFVVWPSECGATESSREILLSDGVWVEA